MTIALARKILNYHSLHGGEEKRNVQCLCSAAAKVLVHQEQHRSHAFALAFLAAPGANCTDVVPGSPALWDEMPLPAVECGADQRGRLGPCWRRVRVGSA